MLNLFEIRKLTDIMSRVWGSDVIRKIRSFDLTAIVFLMAMGNVEKRI